MDLQKEADFSKFLKDETKSYDANSPWYRWRTTVSEKQLQQFISEKIKSRYEKIRHRFRQNKRMEHFSVPDRQS